MFDYKYMKMALETISKTKIDKASPEFKATMEVPIAAIIVYNDKIISQHHNLTICQHDPTAHAEILALRHASTLFSSHTLDKCDLYTTLEPCAMCAYAISRARIRRLYFGAYNRKGGSVESGARVFQYCNYVPEIYGGILEAECAQMLKDFFKSLRTIN